MLDPDISTAAALRHLRRPEHDPLAMDRRRFLQLVGLGVGAGALAGPGSTLLDHLVGGHDPSAWALGPVAPGEGILVVIGMSGGNDGLNTVVPVGDGRYHDQHGALALSPSSTLPLNAGTGLHPQLTELKRIWDEGNLAIVEGVGLPVEDFSHFSSMARWMSARPTGLPSSGWIGRWLDGYVSGAKDLYAAADIGKYVPLQLIGEAARGTAVPAGAPAFGASTRPHHQKVYQAVRTLNAAPLDTWEGRIGATMVDHLDFAARVGPSMPQTLATTGIEAQLEVAARLINANLGFRVITATFGDFDHHALLPDRHPQLLGELNAAIRRFYEVLHPGWNDNVVMMTFSEFGRTSWANDGLGSDHGSSAPHFVFGSKVRGGFHGQRPTLSGLGRWDRMATHVDVRDYFGSIVDGWLGGGGADVMGRPVSDLGLFAGAPGGASFPGNSLGEFVALSPTRIFDTRDGTGGHRGALGPRESALVDVTGRGGIPADGVLAVALNVTSVNTTTNTNFRVFPAGLAVPSASSLNPRPGRAVPNMVVVGVGTGGRVGVYNHNGHADCVVDVMGYYTGRSAARLIPLTPARVLDTRTGLGGTYGRVRGGTRVDVQITGRGDVPISGVDAVVLNVGSVAPTARGFVTAWPYGEPRPDVSNLNYSAGMNIPNLVMCKLGDGGRISLFANAGELDLIADVVGCYAVGGSRLVPVAPVRLLDTRDGIGVRLGRVGRGGVVSLQVAGRGGVPVGANAVVMNVTAAQATTRTFVTAYPSGESRPEASNLNVAAGQTTANLVIAKLGPDGRTQLYNHNGSIDLIADVTGYYL